LAFNFDASTIVVLLFILRIEILKNSKEFLNVVLFVKVGEFLLERTRNVHSACAE